MPLEISWLSERFERFLGDASEDVRRRFYCDNFLDLVGTAAASRLTSGVASGV